MRGAAIIVLGPPAAGKGTQAWRLGEEFGLPRISTGDMLRDAVRDGSDLGEKARSFIEAGELVPDEVVDRLVGIRLGKPDCATGFILDGYPRTLPQAKSLSLICGDMQVAVCVVGIQAGDGVLVSRIASRWTCGSCGKVFNAVNRPADGHCDACGAELEHRLDDSVDVFRERLDVYRKQTAPLIEYYRSQGVFHEVDGEAAIDEIYGRVSAIVRKQLAGPGTAAR